MAKPRLQEIKLGNFLWMHINHPTELETNQLANDLKFHVLDLKDVLPPIQRPKLVEREDYLFMILLYPVYDRDNRKIHAVEVDFFIGRNFLVTSSSEEFFPISDFFNRLKKQTGKKEKVNLFGSPAELLYEVLKQLENYCLPMSIHISNDIDKVENEVFSSTAKEDAINEVLRIKTNIVNFRKALNRHNRILQHLILKISKNFSSFSAELFKSLVEEAEDIWEMLENYQDTINAIHESQVSLLNYRSNIIMEVFTIFTTIIFALELAISFITLGTDFYKDPLSLLAIFGGLTVIALIMVMFFKKKRWI